MSLPETKGDNKKTPFETEFFYTLFYVAGVVIFFQNGYKKE